MHRDETRHEGGSDNGSGDGKWNTLAGENEKPGEDGAGQDTRAGEAEVDTTAVGSGVLGRITAYISREEREVRGGAAIVGIVFLGLFGWSVGWGNLFNGAWPVEGDQVAQNWWLQEFASRFWGLFTGGHLFGWTDDFGAGMPFGYFYFPLPAIAYSLLDVVLPGAVAAKLVQLIGAGLVPMGVYWAVRLLRGSRASATFAGLAVTIGMFFPQKYPVGGDISSTLVGEYSYAWGLGLGLVAVAAVAACVAGRTGHRKAGVLVALAVLSHVNAAFALASGGAVYVLGGLIIRRRRARDAGETRVEHGLVHGVKSMGTALLLASFWLLPLWSMREEIQGNNKLTDRALLYWFPGTIWKVVLVAGLLGLALGTARKSAGARMFAVLGLGAFAVYEALTEWHSFELWSGRCMPVIYTGLLVGVGELLDFVYQRGRGRSAKVASVVVCIAVLAGGGYYQQREVTENINEWRIRLDQTWEGFGRGSDQAGARARVEELTRTVAGLEPGRILYGLNADGYKIYGARDLNGELVRAGAASGASTFFHEGNRGRYVLAYGTSANMTHPSGIEPGGRILGVDDFYSGVEMMRQFGIRYYVIGDVKLHELAKKEDRLELLAAIGEVTDGDNKFFEIYEIRDAAVVEAVRKEPGIVKVLPLWGETTWDGKVKQWLARLKKERFDGIYLVEDAPSSIAWEGRAEYGDAGVGNVVVSDERVSFTVAKTEIPVVVRMGYSSRWKVKGGTGVYHVAPHGMIVIPTDTEVVLEYQHPIEERIGMVISLATLVAMVAGSVRRRKPEKHPGTKRAAKTSMRRG